MAEWLKAPVSKFDDGFCGWLRRSASHSENAALTVPPLAPRCVDLHGFASKVVQEMAQEISPCRDLSRSLAFDEVVSVTR